MAKAETKNEAPKGTVTVKITKFGAGQVSTGEHEPGVGDIMFKHGDTFECSPETAKGLEALGFAETV